jgi:tetratricopeptide (TPR) repeat protein
MQPAATHKCENDGLMGWNCLIVNFSQQVLAEDWHAQFEKQQLGLGVIYSGTLEEAMGTIEKGDVCCLAIFAQKNSPELQTIFKSFQRNVGGLADFQALIADDPDPIFMATVFEFGIEQFFATATWISETAGFCRRVSEKLNDPSSLELKTLKLTRSICSADQSAIKEASVALSDVAQYDFRAAFATGKACEATGQYSEAAEVFHKARNLNKKFRPSSSSLGEALMVTGKIDEALEVFHTMEKSNPHDVDRKANLAAAYIEKGNLEKAQEYVHAANDLAPNSPRVLEAKAQILLKSGKISEAFALMDEMSEVGPFFAGKLNQLGIQLSQAGKGKSALALYRKAHRIVRAELRYKISMNAALACRRLEEWDMALKYCDRVEKEFGSSFEKLEKIRQALRAARAKGGRQRQAS